MFPSRTIARSTVFSAIALAATLGLSVEARGQGTAGTSTQGQGAGGQGAGQGQRGGGRGTTTTTTQTNQPARDTTQQQPTMGTGSIAGVLTLAGSGTPVRHARLMLTGNGLRPSRTAQTNDQGGFSFPSLPAGRFTLTASKPGYVDMSYGAKQPGRPGTPIQLIDGQKLEKVNFSLPKGSVITGTVVDENGEASPGTQVRAMRYVMRTGEKTLQAAGSDTTDDRGVYRIYGQPPGDYIVSAVPRNANISDLRQTVMAEVESLLQQAQAANAVPGGPGGANNGGGRGGGRGGAQGLGAIGNNIAGVGRGQAYIDQANALQAQLQQQGDQTPSVAYAPVYFPGTITSTAATTLTLGLGEERAGVDFQLQLVPTARIDGTLTSPTGSIPPGVQIQIAPAGQNGQPFAGANLNVARAGQDGKFSFTNITPGQYTISARATIRSQNQSEEALTQQQQQSQQPQSQQQNNGRGGFGPRGGGPGAIAQILWASTDVAVAGQNLPNVVLNLQPGMAVSGTVSFQATSLAPPTDLTRVRVTIQSRGPSGSDIGGIPAATVDATGHFTITGVPPGNYVLQGSAPVGAAGGGRGGGAAAVTATGGSWALKSAIVGGRDVLDFPLEVQPNTDVGGAVLTFTDRTQQLSGMLQDASGRPTSDYTIIVFPSDKAYWLPQSRRIQSTRPGTDGTYTIRGIPPGDYRVIAVTDVDTGEWYDPDFLGQLVGAGYPISLGEGQQKVQDLRVAGGGQ
jgi:hypothetical protein